MQDTAQVARDLAEIASLLEFSGESKFKVNAYRRGADIVEALGAELGSLVEQDRLREIEGIGSALSRQIEELWNAGTSELLERLRGEQPEGAAELMQVPGLTVRRIRALGALGVRSVTELIAAANEGRIRALPGFGEKTEARLRAAAERWLTRAEAPLEPMLLATALELSRVIQKRLLEVVSSATPVGALRRGEETLRELEFVVVGDAERALEHVSGLRRVLRIDRAELTAILTEHVTLRLHRGDPVRLGTVLVQTTGDGAHLEAVERRAAGRGISLATAEFADESALYSALGSAFVPPELRRGAEELEEASHGGFGDLLEASDIQGVVHCHTTYSDGKNSVLEMARAAHALGMKYITITDHSPSAHYARGVAIDRLRAQWDEIAEAEAQVPIRILRGTESDITSDGGLDYPDAILAQFDIVIASIHARHRMDRAAMTARLVRAMALPLFKVWGHALGRILNHRPEIDCDVPAVLDALAGSRGAIEINADPHRLDLPPAWIPAARERGLPFLVSVDAHSTRGLGVLQYGVTMARRGGLRRAEVLNTQSAAEFSARVRPMS